MKPCLTCGEPSDQTRCTEHRRDDHHLTAHERGYTAAWRRLSVKARRLQPFCTDCGAAQDLQADHTPEAWARHDAGKPIRLADIDVVCGPCNRTRGAARSTRKPLTRGDDPNRSGPTPDGKAQRAMKGVSGALR